MWTRTSFSRRGLLPVLPAFIPAIACVRSEVGMLEEKTQDLMINIRGLLPLIVSNGLNVLGAILILLIGLWLAGKADQLVVRMLSRAPHFGPDPLLDAVTAARPWPRSPPDPLGGRRIPLGPA